MAGGGVVVVRSMDDGFIICTDTADILLLLARDEELRRALIAREEMASFLYSRNGCPRLHAFHDEYAESRRMILIAHHAQH